MIKSRCPVPPEQLPINQYEDMCDSWFYRWGSLEMVPFLKPLVILWLSSWAIVGPIVAASYAPERFPVPFLLLAAAGACIVPVLALLQLYFGWLHVGERLQQAAVPYEESGWYDGQVWKKPDEVLNRDRLIRQYQVQPVLNRIKAALFSLLCLGVALVTTWRFV